MTDRLFDLTGQVAIVTGTSRGLGQEFARALAKAGADLVLTSRHRETLTPFALRSRRWAAVPLPWNWMCGARRALQGWPRKPSGRLDRCTFW